MKKNIDKEQQTKKQINLQNLARKYEEEQDRELCDSYREMGKEITLVMERGVNFQNMLANFMARSDRKKY